MQKLLQTLLIFSRKAECMQPLYSLLTYSSLVSNIEVPYTTRVPGSRHSYPVVEDGTPVPPWSWSGDCSLVVRTTGDDLSEPQPWSVENKHPCYIYVVKNINLEHDLNFPIRIDSCVYARNTNSIRIHVYLIDRHLRCDNRKRWRHFYSSLIAQVDSIVSESNYSWTTVLSFQLGNEGWTQGMYKVGRKRESKSERGRDKITTKEGLRKELGRMDRMEGKLLC